MSDFSSGIILTPDHWGQMVADINSRASEEACGFVLGIGFHAMAVIPVTNILHDATRFRMAPEEQLNAYLLAEGKGWEILAVYHSHPHGISRPSPTDLDELTYPGIIYLIWYQTANAWQCRGYLMRSQTDISEVPLLLSTNE